MEKKTFKIDAKGRFSSTGKKSMGRRGGNWWEDFSKEEFRKREGKIRFPRGKSMGF